MNGDDFEGKTDLPFSEIKAENTINRITSEANPRFFERVPKGAEFELNIVINVFGEESGDTFSKGTFEALELVQDDYIGGGGSRGNGQVEILIEEVLEKDDTYYKASSENKKLPNLVEAYQKKGLIPSELKIKKEKHA